MRRVLVTGATGFIGSHLSRRLRSAGEEVHVFCRRRGSRDRVEELLPDVTVWEGDLTDVESLERCVRGSRPCVVFHLAGESDVRLLDSRGDSIERSVAVNLAGTLNVLKAAGRHGSSVERVVRAGGLEEYGDGPVPYSEEQREAPVSPYSASQVAATHYCQMLQRSLPFAVVTLRLALVYGPGQSEKFFVPSLIRHCLDGRAFELRSGGHARDLIYVDDAVDALLQASEAGEVGGQVINVGSGSEIRIRDLASTILELTGSAISLTDKAAADRYFDLPHLWARNDKALRLLGWKPTTALREGLTRTIDWYRGRPRTVRTRRG